MSWNRITSWNHRISFVFVLLSVCLCETGCATANTWSSLGKTRTGVDRILYQYSPDTREVTAKYRTESWGYWTPVIPDFWPTHTYEDKENRYRLPDNMVRFRLEIVEDSSVRSLYSGSEKPTRFSGIRPPYYVQYFHVPIRRRIDEDFDFGDQTRYLTIAPGETLQLRLNPHDVPFLPESSPFFIRYEWQDRSGKTISTVQFMIPYAKVGNCYEMDACAFLLYRAEEKDERKDTTGPLGYCWKILWLPLAVVADTIALPTYLVVGAAFVHDMSKF